MDYNQIKNVYNEALDDFVAFADKADYLNEKPKQQFMSFKLKMFNQRLDIVHKREAYIRKAANKLFQASLKEMKRELKEKTKRRRQEFIKLKLLTKLRTGSDVAPIESTANCETCANCHFDEVTCSLCCKAYNLSFTSEEMYMQFCKCFCNSYAADEAVDEPTTDETAETEQVNEETETPSDMTTEPTDEAKPTKETKQEPTCCKECTSCKIDENEQCYCSKYDVDLDANDADSICYCEQDDFFGESDE